MPELERAERFLLDRLSHLLDEADRTRLDTRIGREYLAKITPDVCEIVRTLRGGPS